MRGIVTDSRVPRIESAQAQAGVPGPVIARDGKNNTEIMLWRNPKADVDSIHMRSQCGRLSLNWDLLSQMN